MLVLGLETSCDETGVALYHSERGLLADALFSQIEQHRVYGGVVPELASRDHVKRMLPLIREVLAEAKCTPGDIQAVAYTAGPGLVGALLVGLSVAKSIAFARDIPLVGVHHMEGHILAPLLEQEIPFPYLALAVSGGHTHLYRVDDIGSYRILGRTLDDAAGEAFDKVAKLLGLGYPGGVLIDRLAVQGNPRAIDFPRPLLHQKNLDFSFSGIKTAVLNHVRRQSGPIEGDRLKDLAASFQEAVVDVLSRKTMRASEETGLKRVVVAGGVACNSGLRARMQTLSGEKGVSIHFPSPALCGDNAAMLAVAGDRYLEEGRRAPLELNALANWPLDQAGAELSR